MITIVDYQAGNLTSVKWALEELGHPACVTSNPAAVIAAERLIFPGVGAAGAAMRHLRERGLADALRDAAAAGVPLLGICLGMQILFERSEEDGGVETLGLLPGTVRRFRPSHPRDKVPHMGWNRVRWVRPHPLLEGLPNEMCFYFVHSYYVRPARPEVTLGLTDYADESFCAAAAADNLLATQFHIEKSGPAGLMLLDRFARWDGHAPPPRGEAAGC